eukprot:scaffold27654_cov58-Phaeocystis_antarctica.AAC.2
MAAAAAAVAAAGLLACGTTAGVGVSRLAAARRLAELARGAAAEAASLWRIARPRAHPWALRRRPPRRCRPPAATSCTLRAARRPRPPAFAGLGLEARGSGLGLGPGLRLGFGSGTRFGFGLAAPTSPPCATHARSRSVARPPTSRAAAARRPGGAPSPSASKAPTSSAAGVAAAANATSPLGDAPNAPRAPRSSSSPTWRGRVRGSGLARGLARG